MKYSLKITSAVVIGGVIRKPDEIVAVDERAAKDLLHRGKAIPASNDDVQPVEAAPVAEPEQKPKSKKAKADAEANETLS